MPATIALTDAANIASIRTAEAASLAYDWTVDIDGTSSLMYAIHRGVRHRSPR